MTTLLPKILPWFLFALPLCASLSVSLNSSLPSPQPVGTTITWTPTATQSGSGSLDYRFKVSANGVDFQTFQDYDVADTFEWTPYYHEGTFAVQVTVRNLVSQQVASATATFTIAARTAASGGSPVISSTANPLVALYSAPGCPAGNYLRVRFVRGFKVQRTTAVACSPLVTSNLYVAGMLPSTAYAMNYEVVTLGGSYTSGPVQVFTTGMIDPTLTFPDTAVTNPATTDTQQSVVLLNPLSVGTLKSYFPFATDLSGRILWYYAKLPPISSYNIWPVPGGTMIMLATDPNHPELGQQIIREIDLAGNTVRQTSTKRLSQLLVAAGKYPIVGVDHEVIRLANGHTLLIASQEKLFPAGTQGSTRPVDILGDAILELDANLQITWSWSAYDHLDINRPAVLGETCNAGEVVGCPPIYLASVANDWIHGNSLSVGTDGSLLFSSRHQDLVYKIDYAFGTGSGNVVWKLGLDGDFAMTGTTDPYPWFSHQHDVNYQLGTTNFLTVYDNGDTRVAAYPGEHSRGQALVIDENAMTARLALNADLGVYSVALGTAQLLDSFDYWFTSGWVLPGQYAQTTEVDASGALSYTLVDMTPTYRSYRMSSLYSVR